MVTPRDVRVLTKKRRVGGRTSHLARGDRVPIHLLTVRSPRWEQIPAGGRQTLHSCRCGDGQLHVGRLRPAPRDLRRTGLVHCLPRCGGQALPLLRTLVDSNPRHALAHAHPELPPHRSPLSSSCGRCCTRKRTLRSSTRNGGRGARSPHACWCSCPCSTRRSSRGASSTTPAEWSIRATGSRCSAWMTRRTQKRARSWTRASRIGASKALRSTPSAAPIVKATRQARCTRCMTPSRQSSSPYSTQTSCRSRTSSSDAFPCSRTGTWASCRGVGHT